MSFGNLGFIQAKASVNGALTKKIAGRLSFSGTQRNGVTKDIVRQKSINDLNNIGFSGQLLFAPSEKLKISLVGDISDQKPEGYAQASAGVAQTKIPGYRQFDSIIADLNYQLPSRNPFDRIVDHNT